MKYSHLFDIAFTVETNKEDPNTLTAQELVNALQTRIEALLTDDKSIQVEAFGFNDTIELED